jgi:ABC-type dipeptide/oligopeptide/nickel transport system permease component
MGITLISAGLVAAGNLLADVAYSLVDPRIRYE